MHPLLIFFVYKKKTSSFSSNSELRTDREAFGTPKEREKYVLSNKIWTFFLRPLWGGQKAKKEQF